MRIVVSTRPGMSGLDLTGEARRKFRHPRDVYPV
jgi:hypothetical protein